MNTAFIPVAVTGILPARGGGKKWVNYCFKSSCEINETLRALCWLKRSVATFNSLFNHTTLELCVCSCCPLLSTVDMFVPCQQHRHSQRRFLQIKTENPLNVTRAQAHQTALIEHRALSFAKCIVVIAIFVCLHCFSARIILSKSSLYVLCSERKWDFTLTVSFSLCWSHHIYIFNYFYFFLHKSLGVLTLMLTQCVCL